ncbi:MAG: hypothetical protein ACFCU8_01540 [Thermosynechococcaceae cyanobacterium]
MLLRYLTLCACGAALTFGSIAPVGAIPIDRDPPIPEIPPSPPQPPQPPQPAQREVRVSASLLASLANVAVSGSQLHLNSHGPRQGNSWHVANDSYLRLSSTLGGGTYPFNIAEVVKDLDCGTFCPELGDAKLYVSDFNLQSTQVTWEGSAFKLSLLFESNGREIKGHNTGRLNLVPDVEINNARLDIFLQPIALNGRLAYRVIKTDFKANIQATGGCSIPGFGKICDWITNYKDRIVSEVKGQVLNRLNDPALRDRISNVVQPELAKVGITSVTRVRVEGDDLVISTPLNRSSSELIQNPGRLQRQF